MTEPGARPSSRPLALVVVVGLVAGGLVAFAAGRAWKEVGHSGITGRELDDIPYALGLVGLAGSIAVLAAGRILRPVVGVVLAVTGAGAAILSYRAATRPFTAGSFSYAPLSATRQVSTTVWPWVSVATSALLALVGLAVIVRGNRWPGMGRRYDAPGTRRSRAVDPQVSAWDALDRGEDPTRGQPGDEP